MNNEFKIDSIGYVPDPVPIDWAKASTPIGQALNDPTELLRFSPEGEITFFWDAIEKHAEKPLCMKDVSIGYCKALMKLKQEQKK